MYGDVYARSGNSSGWGTSWQLVGGGSGAATSSNALCLKGKDPLTNISEDNPASWKALGAGIWEITPNGSQYINDGTNLVYLGTLINLPASSYLTQLWIAPISGNIFVRSAAGDSWSGTWTPLRYNKNEIVQEVLAALPTWTGGSY